MKSESKNQSKIIEEYEKRGYFVIKIIRSNKNGIADLICLKQNEVLFIEVKRADGKLSELQKFRIEELKKYGIETKVLSDII